MEVSSQEERANLQGMKVFAVERPGLPEDFVYVPALCGVQSNRCHSYLLRICRLFGVRYRLAKNSDIGQKWCCAAFLYISCRPLLTTSVAELTHLVVPSKWLVARSTYPVGWFCTVLCASLLNQFDKNKMRHAPHFQRSFYFLLISGCRPFHDQMRKLYCSTVELTHLVVWFCVRLC